MPNIYHGIKLVRIGECWASNPRQHAQSSDDFQGIIQGLQRNIKPWSSRMGLVFHKKHSI